jgi:hypothetical protein
LYGKRILLTSRLRRTGGAAACALATASALSAAALGSTAATTVFLSSNRGHDISQVECIARGGCGPEAIAPVVLVNGRSYAIRVSGTISVWSFWAANPCGHPRPRPEFPTPGQITPTGDDAVFRFAFHVHFSGDRCEPVPRRTGLFQINLGSGWFSPTALGNPARPARAHEYSFRVVGQGFEPRFRYVDYHPSDNDGKFRIVISSAS